MDKPGSDCVSTGNLYDPPLLSDFTEYLTIVAQEGWVEGEGLEWSGVRPGIEGKWPWPQAYLGPNINSQRDVWIQAGSKLIPEYPVKSNTQAMYELKKAVGSLFIFTTDGTGLINILPALILNVLLVLELFAYARKLVI